MNVRDDLVRSVRWVDGHADVWRWFADGALFRRIVGELADPFRGVGITKVATLEARGFVLAGAVAKELGAGVVGVRKRVTLCRVRSRRSLPHRTIAAGD